MPVLALSWRKVVPLSPANRSNAVASRWRTTALRPGRRQPFPPAAPGPLKVLHPPRPEHVTGRERVCRIWGQDAELDQPVDVVRVDPGPLGDLLAGVSAHAFASIAWCRRAGVAFPRARTRASSQRVEADAGDDGAVHAPISQEPGTGFDPANSPMLGVLAPALAWRGPDAALVAGASFSHHAQGGGSWRDGSWHAQPPPASPPTNPAPEPAMAGSLVQSGRLRWLHRLPQVVSWHATVSTVPRVQGQGRPPGQATGRGSTMTEPSVSFAGNSTSSGMSFTRQEVFNRRACSRRR